MSAFAFAGALIVVTANTNDSPGIASANATPTTYLVASSAHSATQNTSRTMTPSTQLELDTDYDPEIAAARIAKFTPSAPADWQDQVASLVADGEQVLANYSDAARTVEDQLASAIATLRTANATSFNSAKTALENARGAVIADAEAFRAWVSSEASDSWQPGGDVNAQIDYLRTYATEYNVAEFGDYNDVGGDCVNYVSQGLLARGWTMDDAWYSDGPWTTSSAWVYVPALESYFAELGIPSSGLDNIDRLRVGDIGVFDWGEDGPSRDHVMTVSRVDYTADGPVIYFASHNSDGFERELWYSMYTEHSDSNAWFYHLPG